MPDVHAVEIDVRHGVDAFKKQEGLLVRLVRPVKTGGVNHMGGFVVHQFQIVAAKERLLHQPVPHPVQRPVAGYLRRNGGSAAAGQLSGCADFFLYIAAVDNREAPAVCQFQSFFHCLTHPAD